MALVELVDDVRSKIWRKRSEKEVLTFEKMWKELCRVQEDGQLELLKKSGRS